MEVKNKNIVMISNIKNYLLFKKNELKMILKNLQDNNPIAVMNRGFALIYKEKVDKNFLPT